MKIVIAGSMQFSEKMLKVAEELKKLGHEPFTSKFAPGLAGHSDEYKEKEKNRQKMDEDAIREFWYVMKDTDALLVLNFDKNGIKNYIGGNAFLEIGFAHVLNQKVFLWNPIPEIPYYKTEIEAVRPVILNGDLGKIQ